MNCFQITMKRTGVADALEHIDTLPNMERRQRNCLRLLAEEMFSMMDQLLQNREATFELNRDGNEYALSLKCVAYMTEAAKKEFLSISSSGKNLAHKGLRGKMNALIDSLASVDPYTAMPEMDLEPMSGPSSYMWTMSRYLDVTPIAEQEIDWDGMEKSIIANFADDVQIGVKNSKLEMIVKKKF